MADILLETTRTVVTMVTFADALLDYWATFAKEKEQPLPGHHQLYVPPMTKEIAGVLWAHCAGETTNGYNCWNWNLGNMKHVKGDGYDYVALAGVWEGFDSDKVIAAINSGLWVPDDSVDHAKAVDPKGTGKRVPLIATKKNPARWFRAYADLVKGMANFVLSKTPQTDPEEPPRRYETVWPFLVTGNHRAYAYELGKRGYYSASPDAYAAALGARYALWMASDAYEKTYEARVPTADQLEAEHQPIVRNHNYPGDGNDNG